MPPSSELRNSDVASDGLLGGGEESRLIISAQIFCSYKDTLERNRFTGAGYPIP